MEGLQEILQKLSSEDLEKLKILFSSNAGKSIRDIISLRVFCNEYKELIKSNRSNSYYKSVETTLKHLTNYFGPQRPISSLTYKDIEQFVTHLKQTVKKGYRVYFRTLKASFNKALDWGYIEENYFTKIKLPKTQRIQPIFISEAELEKITNKIKSNIERDFIVFGFYTGLRLGEIINLKWKNVDFERNIIIIGDDEFETKGRNQRVVPINIEVGKILENRTKRRKSIFVSHIGKGEKEKGGYVFCKNNGMPYTGDFFSKRFKQAVRSAGLSEKIHFHTLRHSFASHLAQRNVSIYVIKELLGHANITTTSIYAHLNIDSLRQAVNMLNTTSPLPSPYKGDGVTDRLSLVIGGSNEL